MKHIRMTAFAAAAMLFLTAMNGCGKNEEKKKEIVKYSSFFCQNGISLSEDNTARQTIAEQTGAMCIETWLGEKEDEDKVISDMIVDAEYPDFLYPTSLTAQKLLKANAFIPIDQYWDDYPNIRNYFTEDEWDKIRQEDGHIYFIPACSKCYMYDTNTIHNDEAFWVQVKVLQWAGYPKIVTLDDYFDLLEDYVAANPVNENGEQNIAYEILADESIFFCLDNPPMFLSGYPNDGACIVEPDTHKVVDYNTIDNARRWFQKLNEEYKKGVIDPEFSIQSPDEYFEKIKSGRVLGMVDQHWNFNAAATGLPEECEYVPIGVVLDEGTEEHYHSAPTFDPSSGLGISVSCDDPEGALKFVDDLLSPEIHRLRFWGEEGTDYSEGEGGLFYLTDEQAALLNDKEYENAHRCYYGFFPYYYGMDRDGINAYRATYQPSEFYKHLSPIMKECFDAYGVQTYVELLNQAGENQPWYPMWSYTNTFTDETPAGRAKADIENVKFRYMPRMVMVDEFDAVWEEYMDAYATNCDADAYVSALQEYVDNSLK